MNYENSKTARCNHVPQTIPCHWTWNTNSSEKNETENNKCPYSDKTRNEMIKTSLNEMMPVYHKLFNNIINGGSMPLMWCSGLITSTFKSGGRNDPTNYRGICVSSCLGKLFCSILNQRLMERVNTLNIHVLHNSQIGFLPNNRTADHVLTLGTLIDKYVQRHQEKVYACFVGFRKAFDSCLAWWASLQIATNKSWREFLWL